MPKPPSPSPSWLVKKRTIASLKTRSSLINSPDSLTLSGQSSEFPSASATASSTSSSPSLASTSSAPPPSSTPETAAQGFTFKEALATVPLFYGSPEEDIVSWLQEITTLVGDSGMAAKDARSKLAGKPKEWLASLKSPIPATAAGWEILSMSLKSLYCDPLRTRSALEELK